MKTAIQPTEKAHQISNSKFLWSWDFARHLAIYLNMLMIKTLELSWWQLICLTYIQVSCGGGGDILNDNIKDNALRLNLHSQFPGKLHIFSFKRIRQFLKFIKDVCLLDIL